MAHQVGSDSAPLGSTGAEWLSPLLPTPSAWGRLEELHQRPLAPVKCLGFVPLNFRCLLEESKGVFLALLSCAPSGGGLAPEPEQSQEGSDVHLGCFSPLRVQLRL